MRAIGVCYDTGFVNRGNSTHEPFDIARVREDMRVIREDLRCDAVRITGGYPDRLKLAASEAAAAGLEVWLCPFLNDVTEDEVLAVVADCAEHAERLRTSGASVVLAVGSELTMFVLGFLPGDTLDERSAALRTPEGQRALAGIPRRVNDLLARAATIARERFHGKLTYCSLPFENVNWDPFDILATDAGYRGADLAPGYVDAMRAFVAEGERLGKPVAITEFGCPSFRGAPDAGPHGFDIIDWDPATARPLRLNGSYERDEQAQAAHITELLDILDAAGVDAAFCYCFARYDLPHRENPLDDLDLASPGLVRVLESGDGPTLTWQPKAAFTALADRI
ncbi:hypothetical protein VMT65_11035 [Nocardia sp. CDC153]|uniref:hypothetical protein n=1 Tax=Nocardia sp. CDC153 TaxID=3112167 RepID=UPI002DBB692F|nr:hypothetical protein [Nocardia sp. CDC153]MEC3953567.1 hypothetical protein [Nocardia sp. CDC153]